MSYSRVRDALVASVACTAPPVSFQTIQLSTVPTATSGPAVRPPAVNSHSSFEPEKYGSSTSPVVDRTIGSSPSASSAAHRSAVRRSCHTSARCKGSEVVRLHATIVSRWLVMPMAAGASSSAGGHLGQRGLDRLPDLGGVVFDPPGPGEVLGELPVGPADGSAVLVDGNGANAGGAGIDGEDDGHGAAG